MWGSTGTQPWKAAMPLDDIFPYISRLISSGDSYCSWLSCSPAPALRLALLEWYRASNEQDIIDCGVNRFRPEKDNIREANPLPILPPVSTN